MISPRFSTEIAVSSFGKDGSREHSVLFKMFMFLRNVFFKK